MVVVDMAAASSTDPRSDALPKKGVVWERLRNAKDSAIALDLGKDDSWVRKVRNGECGVLVEDIPALLHALGLKPVDTGKVCVDRELAEAMATMHAKLAPRVPKLLWEDAE